MTGVPELLQAILMLPGLPDFETDTRAALQYLKHRQGIHPDSIGVIGHSEGAFIAFTLAARKEVPFIITLAGGGVNGSELLLRQRAALLQANGAKEEFINTYNQYMRQAQEIVLQTADAQTCERKLTELLPELLWQVRQLQLPANSIIPEKSNC